MMKTKDYQAMRERLVSAHPAAIYLVDLVADEVDRAVVKAHREERDKLLAMTRKKGK